MIWLQMTEKSCLTFYFKLREIVEKYLCIVGKVSTTTKWKQFVDDYWVMETIKFVPKSKQCWQRPHFVFPFSNSYLAISLGYTANVGKNNWKTSSSVFHHNRIWYLNTNEPQGIHAFITIHFLFHYTRKLTATFVPICYALLFIICFACKLNCQKLMWFKRNQAFLIFNMWNAN